MVGQTAKVGSIVMVTLVCAVTPAQDRQVPRASVSSSVGH